MSSELPVSLTQGCIRAIRAGRKSQMRIAVAYSNAPCPLGGPGDGLWVREPWALEAREGVTHEGNGGVLYQADNVPGVSASDPLKANGVEWRHPREMPRELSRIHLRIRRIHLEHVQEIDDGGLRAEGGMWRESTPLSGESDREGFARWWSDVHARSGHTWERDPWVWVIEFDVIEEERCPAR